MPAEALTYSEYQERQPQTFTGNVETVVPGAIASEAAEYLSSLPEEERVAAAEQVAASFESGEPERRSFEETRHPEEGRAAEMLARGIKNYGENLALFRGLATTGAIRTER